VTPEQLRAHLAEGLERGGPPYSPWTSARVATPRTSRRLDGSFLADLRIKYDPRNLSRAAIDPDTLTDLWYLLDLAEAILGQPREETP